MIPEKKKWLLDHKGPVLPITLKRADLISKHPHAQPDQVICLVAMAQKEVIAFLGVLPEKISGVPMGWLSTIWVHPKWQGQGIAARLTEQMMEFWHGHIAATGFIPGLDILYRKKGLVNSHQLKGRRFYLYENMAELARIRKIPFGFTLSGYSRWPKWTKKGSEVMPAPIYTEQGCGLRDSHSLKWWEESSFVSPIEDFTGEAQQYPFSRVSEDFYKFHGGPVWVTQRNKNAVVSYAIPDFPVDEAISHLMYLSKMHLWKSVTAFQPKVIQEMQTFFSRFVIHKEITREFLWTTALQGVVNPTEIQAGDGDWGLAWG